MPTKRRGSKRSGTKRRGSKRRGSKRSGTKRRLRGGCGGEGEPPCSTHPNRSAVVKRTLGKFKAEMVQVKPERKTWYGTIKPAKYEEEMVWYPAKN